MVSPSHQGPAVIAAGLNDTKLVTADRAEFADPEKSRFRVDSGALDIAMTIGPDVRARVCAVNERAVGGDGAVAVDAHDLAKVIGEVLSAVPLEAIPQRNQ